jgi:hypothetical protein
MKTLILTLTLMFVGVMFLFAAELVRKETVEPCVIALEEIAEVVNDKIYPE